MGYNIMIGNAILNPLDEEWDELKRTYSVEIVRHDNAPAFGEPTDHENQRWPSYSTWADMSRETGLYDMFFNEETGIMRKHPGCFRLYPDHLTQVKAAIEKRKRQTGNRPAGYWDQDEKTWENTDNGKDYWLIRLIWLEYWIEWALNNCKLPAIENS